MCVCVCASDVKSKVKRFLIKLHFQYIMIVFYKSFIRELVSISIKKE